MSATTTACPTWCTGDDLWSDGTVVHGTGGVTLDYLPGDGCRLEVNRIVEADGSTHDVIHYESDTVEVRDAEAFARAILAAIATGQ